MFDRAEVGFLAPVLSLREDEAPRPRRPRVLGFVRAWSIDREPERELAHVREQLAELDAELVIACDDGAWSFVRDRQPVYCERLAADVVTAAAAYGVTADAAFVIDHRGVTRFAHRTGRPLGARLTDAHDAAVEALEWRDPQTKLQHVLWTPREWALKCLVVGCSLTFAGTAAEQRRFARGTGPLVKWASRDVITPRAAVGAPGPQFADVWGWASAPSRRRS